MDYTTIDGYKKISAFYCIQLEDKSVMPSTNYQNQTIFVGLVCIESTTAVNKKKRKKTMRRNHRNMKKQYQFTFLLSKESRVYHY